MSNVLKSEVFAVGKWNGLEFTLDDLKSIVSAFHTLKENLQVPLKMGHNEEQPFTDGQPALGWVTDVELTSDRKLMATFEDVPDIVYEAMKKKLYRNVSIELEMRVEYKGSYFPWVLSGVALLGADIPAVNTLSDLQAYMRKDVSFQKRVVFSTTKGENLYRGINMADENIQQELADLKVKFKVLETSNTNMLEENMSLKQKIAEMKLNFKALEDAEDHRKKLQERAALESSLEQMVKDKQIAPFSRDDYMGSYDDASTDEARKAVVFAVDKLKKTIESNPAYFGREQARIKAENLKEEEGKRPDQVVTDRTRKYMAEHGEKDFSTAKIAVLKADPELANSYKKYSVGG